jgi:hypothetical protein
MGSDNPANFSLPSLLDFARQNRTGSWGWELTLRKM